MTQGYTYEVPILAPTLLSLDQYDKRPQIRSTHLGAFFTSLAQYDTRKCAVLSKFLMFCTAQIILVKRYHFYKEI